MSDVSSNDNFINEDTENNSDVSENTSSGDENETNQTVVYSNDFIDYTSHFENLETIGIFISALLVAYGIAFAFFKGFKK